MSLKKPPNIVLRQQADANKVKVLEQELINIHMSCLKNYLNGINDSRKKKNIGVNMINKSTSIGKKKKDVDTDTKKINMKGNKLKCIVIVQFSNITGMND